MKPRGETWVPKHVIVSGNNGAGGVSRKHPHDLRTTSGISTTFSVRLTGPLETAAYAEFVPGLLSSVVVSRAGDGNA